MQVPYLCSIEEALHRCAEAQALEEFQRLNLEACRVDIKEVHAVQPNARNIPPIGRNGNGKRTVNTINDIV
jgi:hypothetical protein